MVTIDAMGCQVAIADKIVAHEADYLLALKGNQPTLETDVKDYFRTAPTDEVVSKPPVVKKVHGRIETCANTASSDVNWITSQRSHPGQPRSNNIKTILKIYSRVEYPDCCSFETRYYISSAKLDIERLAKAARSHWSVESTHWHLDCKFGDDLSRYRTGHAQIIWPSFAVLLSASYAQTTIAVRQDGPQKSKLGPRISVQSAPAQIALTWTQCRAT